MVVRNESKPIYKNDYSEKIFQKLPSEFEAKTDSSKTSKSVIAGIFLSATKNIYEIFFKFPRVPFLMLTSLINSKFDKL